MNVTSTNYFYCYSIFFYTKLRKSCMQIYIYIYIYQYALNFSCTQSLINESFMYGVHEPSENCVHEKSPQFCSAKEKAILLIFFIAGLIYQH